MIIDGRGHGIHVTHEPRSTYLTFSLVVASPSGAFLAKRVIGHCLQPDVKKGPMKVQSIRRKKHWSLSEPRFQIPSSPLFPNPSHISRRMH